MLWVSLQLLTSLLLHGVFAFAGNLAVPWFHADAATVVVPDVALTLLLSCLDPAADGVTSFASTFDFVC
jgi:hypothetical protein